MTWNILSLTTALLLYIVAGTHAQETSNQPVKQYKSGEIITLKDDFKLKVYSGSNSEFTKVAVKGKPVVIVLEFVDGLPPPAGLKFKLKPPEKSGITLMAGEHRITPIATMDTIRPSEKKVHSIPQDIGLDDVLYLFGRKTFLYWLFDVPTEQVEEDKTVALKFDLVWPQEQEFSFLVNIDK